MIFIVSGPGGVGKGTIVRELVKRDPDLWLSRSWTTRPQRPGEPDDAYNFVTREEFAEHIDKGELLEYVEFLGNFYGTPFPSAPAGLDVLLEIELKGAQQVRARDTNAIVILIVPPSIEVQRERLRGRGDDEKRIAERIAIGEHEMIAGEKIADEIVINDDLETAVQALADIVKKYRESHERVR